ncbi:MAG: hypothetical protein ABL958_07340 [Bdellovibrionia bacterium]
MCTKFQIPLLALLLGLVLSGCASEAEKEERRQNAFDLSGQYTSKTGSALTFTMNVSNEYGRHDVIASMNRSIAQTPQESSFLQAHGINPGTVSSYYTSNLVLGRGSQNSLEGGENISDDFGESSRMSVCAESFKYSSTQTVRYCMGASIRKADWVLRGNLTLYVTTEVKKVDEKGQPYSDYDTESTDLAFTATNGTAFSNQYMGTWSGSVEINEDVGSDSARVTSFTLSKLSDSAFAVSPSVSTLTLQGRAYAYENRSFPITDLEDNVPVVEISFRNTDTDRIVFVGQLRSLGNLTGSIIWISGTTRTHVGTFLFRRN